MTFREGIVATMCCDHGNCTNKATKIEYNYGQVIADIHKIEREFDSDGWTYNNNTDEYLCPGCSKKEVC